MINAQTSFSVLRAFSAFKQIVTHKIQKLNSETFSV